MTWLTQLPERSVNHVLPFVVVTKSTEGLDLYSVVVSSNRIIQPQKLGQWKHAQQEAAPVQQQQLSINEDIISLVSNTHDLRTFESVGKGRIDGSA
jgi:hypothetical protein